MKRSDLIGDEDIPDNGELSGAAICDMVRSAVDLMEINNYSMNNLASNFITIAQTSG
jgi:hypothetical protein